MGDRYRIEHGDCLDLLKREPANSWDAMVTDPPGAISFMGRVWDGNKGGRKQWVAFMAKRFKAALRVLKPGAHAFVWALPRTSHWTGCALEDAGFEIRDCPSHCFGSGFPKSHNLPGGLGTALKPSHELWFLVRKPLEGTIAQNYAKWGTGVLNIDGCRVAAQQDYRDKCASVVGITSPRIAVAYGSFDTSSGREDSSHDDGRWPPNLLLTHDARCRCIGSRAVKANPTWDTPNRETESAFTGSDVSPVKHGGDAEDVPVWECVDGCPVLLLDRQTAGLHSAGYATDGAHCSGKSDKFAHSYGGNLNPNGAARKGDAGTASRFFPQFEWNEDLDNLEPFIYAAKASRGERDKGLEHFKGNAAQRDTPNPGGIDAGSRNVHPTVKSVELMRYLTRLITPPRTDGRCKVGSIFMGSGTDGVAALLEGCDFVGFELNDTDEEPFVSIARARCEHVVGGHYVPRASLRSAAPLKQPSLFEVMSHG